MSYKTTQTIPENANEVVQTAEDIATGKLLNRDKKKEYEKLKELFLGMTSFQISFVEAYIKTASAAQAARMAGSKADKPELVGYKTLQNPNVQMAISIAMKKRIEAVGLDTIEVIQKFREIYDKALEDGKYDAAIKACEGLQREVERAMKAQGGSVNQVGKAAGMDKPVHMEDGVDVKDELHKVLSLVNSKS